MGRKPGRAGLEERIRQLEEEVVERKRAEKTLQIQKAYLEHLLDCAPEAIVLADRNHRITRTNPQFTHLFGYTPKETIGRICDDLIAPAERYNEASDITLRVGHGEAIRVETVRCRKDGSPVTVELMAAPVQAGDEHIGDYVSYRDVTERKRAEDALRESEARHTLIADNVSDSIWLMDLNFKMTWASRSVERNRGYGIDELSRLPLEKLLAPTSLEIVLKTIREELTPERLQQKDLEISKTMDLEFYRKDGSTYWNEVMIKLLRDQEGTPIGILGVGRDIEHRRMREALHESEEKYRLLVESAGEGIVLTQEGKVRYLNPRALEFLAYSQEEIMAQSMIDFVHPDDRKKVTQLYLSKVAGEYVPPASSWRIIDKSGTVKWVQSRSTLLTWEDKPALLSFLIDITQQRHAEEALRESEKKYKDLYEEAPVGYMEFDDNGRITKVNRRELEMLGYTAEEMVGEPAWSFVIEKEKGQELIKAKLAGDRPPSKNLERTYVRKDGITFPGLIEDAVFKDRNGRIMGIRSTIQDITERKRAEEEKERLQAQLLQAQKMESVGRLAGGVAHDFNNMLQAILGHAEMASMTLEQNHSVQKHLRQIQDSALRSAAVVSQLLAFARKQTVSPKVLDLNNTVSAMLKMLRRLIGEDIDLAWVPGHQLWRVKIDPSQVDQILVNLVVNAQDAIAGVGRITIETRNVLLDESYCTEHAECVPGDYVQLVVSDNGAGMSKEILGQLFEPFFTTKEPGKGTGLGLSTIYGIVKQNNGSIEVQSEPGKGASFKVFLPRLELEAAEFKEEPLLEPLQVGTETVLLVEDEEVIRDLAQTLLERLGYTVLSAKTPSLGIRLAEGHEGDLDLLITDVVMPEMNGRDLAERISAIKPALKCLYMSGYTANVISHHGVLDKGVSFIQKPFSTKDFAAKIREVLDKG